MFYLMAVNSSLEWHKNKFLFLFQICNLFMFFIYGLNLFSCVWGFILFIVQVYSPQFDLIVFLLLDWIGFKFNLCLLV